MTTPEAGDNFEAARTRFFARCKELGEQEGMGANTGAQFALEVIRKAHEGIIGLDTKRGSANDDAVRAYNERMLGLKGKSFYKMKERSLATRHAQTRAYIRLGAWPHGGREEPLNMVQNIFEPLWHKEAAMNRKLCYDFNEALARLARKQVHLTTLISDTEELRGFILKAAGKEKLLVDEEEAIANRLEKLVKGKTGKGAQHALMDDDDKIVSALGAIRERIEELRAVQEARNDEEERELEVA